MKKLLICFLALLLPILSLAACGEQSITIDPKNNFPYTYEIVYEVHKPDGTVTYCVSGRDAERNTYYRDMAGMETLFYAREKNQVIASLYTLICDEYILNTESGVYELTEENVVIYRADFEDLSRTAYKASQKNKYRKIDELTLHEDFEGEALYLDAERFDYYQITSTFTGLYEVAVEKNTGICYYACFENGNAFAITRFETPFNGDYTALLPADTGKSDTAETEEPGSAGETEASTEADTAA
jgi:hypothetical protein